MNRETRIRGNHSNSKADLLLIPRIPVKGSSSLGLLVRYHFRPIMSELNLLFHLVTDNKFEGLGYK